jgi:hypothetical protein
MHEWSFREYGHANSPRQRANPGSGRSRYEWAAEKPDFRAFALLWRKA